MNKANQNGYTYLFDTFAGFKKSSGLHKKKTFYFEDIMFVKKNIKELKKIISKYRIDLVLLPFNIFDQRLLKSNILQELKDRNIEIHTRTSL